MDIKVIEFLEESNAIEGVYDDDSLQQSVYAWEYIEEQKELTVGKILKLHKILMKNQDLLPDEKGYFRKCAVYIGGKKAQHHEDVKDNLEYLIEKMNYKSMLSITALDDIVTRELHVEYEWIHPFVDGNGRTGRILMNWWRLRNGLPILVIKADERQEYYKWFK